MEGDAMTLLVAVALVAFLLALAALALLAIGAIWWRRRPDGTRRPGRNREAAAAFLREHADDPRLPRRLSRLAADERAPAPTRLILAGLARYLADPIVLAPAGVPVLGRFDDRAVASVLLWLAWQGIPPDVWAEYFSAAGSTPPEAAGNPTGSASGGRLAAALRRDAAAGRHTDLWPIG